MRPAYGYIKCDMCGRYEQGTLGTTICHSCESRNDHYTCPWGVVYATAQAYSKKFGRPNDDKVLLEVARGLGLHYGQEARGRYAWVDAGRADGTYFEVALRGRYRFALLANKAGVEVWPMGERQYVASGVPLTTAQAVWEAMEQGVANGSAHEKTSSQALLAYALAPSDYMVEGGGGMEFPEDDDI